MKSAYDRAMERFGSEPVKSLTDEQRTEIAAIGDKFRAKIAERELFLNDLVAQAIREGRHHEVPDLKTQLAREIASLESDCETAKEKVRSAP